MYNIQLITSVQYSSTLHPIRHRRLPIIDGLLDADSHSIEYPRNRRLLGLGIDAQTHLHQHIEMSLLHAFFPSTQHVLITGQQ